MPFKGIWYLLAGVLAMTVSFLYLDESKVEEIQQLHRLYEQVFIINEAVFRAHVLITTDQAKQINPAEQSQLNNTLQQLHHAATTLNQMMTEHPVLDEQAWHTWQQQSASYIHSIEQGIATHNRTVERAAFEQLLQLDQQLATQIKRVLERHEQSSEVFHELLLVLAFVFTLMLTWYIYQREQHRQRELELIRQARKKAQRYAHRTQVLMNATEEAIFGVDQQGVCIFANRACLHALGYQQERELLGHPMRQHVIDDGHILDPLQTSQRQHRDDESLLHCDGHRFPIAYWSSPLFTHGDDQPATGLVVTFFDITEKLEHQQAMTQVRDINRRLVACVENAREAIMITDTHNIIEYVNPSFEHLTNIPPTAAVGNDAKQLFATKLKSDFAWQRMRTGELHEEAGHFYIDGGKVLNVEQHRFPIHDENNELCGYAAMLRDVTALREQQSQLEHAQRLESLGVLSGGIAHDFNNILTAILGNAALANTELNDTARVHSYLQHIEHASLRAADLCTQMLAYAGKGRFRMTEVDLSVLIEEMKSLVQVSLNNKVQMTLNLSPSLPLVHGDSAQLQQVVLNLLMNAADSMQGREGSVSVTTCVTYIDPEHLAEQAICEPLPAGDYVCLEVMDDGIGMSENTKLHLFDPFFTTKFTGRGLGMSAVLGIIRAHHGIITLTSEEGVGSCFKVYLPCLNHQNNHEELTMATPTTTTIDDWQGSGTILVIDDEDVIRQTLRMMLTMMGFEVIEAANGEDGIAAYQAQQQQIDLVILDMTMPSMSGDEVFTALQALTPDVRVLLSSGYSDVELKPRFEGRGLAGFLQKPFTPKLLKSQLYDILANPKNVSEHKVGSSFDDHG
jgi:PAS domain S-box-containing protein